MGHHGFFERHIGAQGTHLRGNIFHRRLRLGRLGPERRGEVGPPLIQGERVERVFDVWAEGRVVELVELRENFVEMTWNPEFSDRVPNANALYRDILMAGN